MLISSLCVHHAEADYINWKKENNKQGISIRQQNSKVKIKKIPAKNKQKPNKEKQEEKKNKTSHDDYVHMMKIYI